MKTLSGHEAKVTSLDVAGGKFHLSSSYSYLFEERNSIFEEFKKFMDLANMFYLIGTKPVIPLNRIIVCLICFLSHTAI